MKLSANLGQKFGLLIGTALASVCLGAASAQTGPATADDPTSAAAPERVVILGEGQTRQVQTLTAQDLAIEAPGTSAIKLIQTLPGVNYTAADAFGAYEWAVNINIRGFQKDQLGYTLDGVPLGDMSYGNYNGLHISRAIISEDIGKVDLSQGAAALSTASSSNLGGALAFTSRAPSDDLGGEVALTGGSENTFRGYARGETGIIPGLGGKASLSFVDFTTDKWKGDGKQKQQQIDFRFEQPIGPGTLSGFYDWSKRRENDYQDLSLAMIDRLGYDWDNVSNDWDLMQRVADIANNRGDTGAPITNAAAGTVYPAPFQTVDDAYFNASGLRDDKLWRLTYDLPIGEAVSLSGTVYGHEDEGQGTWYTPYVSPFSFGQGGPNVSPISVRTTEYDLNRSGALGSVKWDIGDNHVEGGFWYEYNDFNQDRRFYANTRTAPRDSLKFMRNPFATQWSFAYDFETTMFYIQDKWDITDALSINAGFKSLKVDLTVGTNVNNFVVPAAGSNDNIHGTISAEDNFLPQIGASYKLAPGSELFAGYTENMRAWTLAPAASNTQAGFDFIKANTDPESSKTTEAGWRYRNGAFQGVVAAYYVKFDNRLLGLSSGAGIIGNPSVIKNVGSVTTKGIEFTGSYDFLDNWNLFGSLSWNDSTYDDDVVDATLPAPILTSGKRVVNAPDLMAKIDLGYDDGSFFAKVSASYTGKRYFSYLENAAAPSYTVVDLSAGYRFHGSPLLEGLEIQGNITNLTDEQYISTVGTNGFNTASDNQTLMVGAPLQGFVTVRKKF